jgi:hypothetical protein
MIAWFLPEITSWPPPLSIELGIYSVPLPRGSLLLIRTLMSRLIVSEIFTTLDLTSFDLICSNVTCSFGLQFPTFCLSDLIRPDLISLISCSLTRSLLALPPAMELFVIWCPPAASISSHVFQVARWQSSPSVHLQPARFATRLFPIMESVPLLLISDIRDHLPAVSRWISVIFGLISPFSSRTSDPVSSTFA